MRTKCGMMVLATAITFIMCGYAANNPIEIAGTLIDQGLRRNLKPEKGWYYENCPSGLARANVVQNIGGNRYLCRVADHFDASVMETLLDVFIVETKREFVDGERLQGGIFKYVGTASYQTVVGAKKTVREFVEQEGPQVQAYYARIAEQTKRQQIEREKAEKDRQKESELLNTEAITNVQNFIKSLNVDLDPRNRIRIDKSFREQMRVVVPKKTLIAMEAKKTGDLSRIAGTKSLVESYKENRKLTQEAVLRFYNEAFRYLNQEVRLEWPGCGCEAEETALAIFRLFPQDEKKLAVICLRRDNFSPFDKIDSFLRKQRSRFVDTTTRVDDYASDLTIRADMSFDHTAAMFVFRIYDVSRNKKKELSYGFCQAEAAFNAVAPRHEELLKQLRREEISKEDFGKKSLELKRELYAALCKASENEGAEKVAAEKAEKESSEMENMAAATEAAKKRFAEQVDPRNRVYIDNAITNNVCALVPKKIREGIDALRNGNFTFFAAISNPNNGMLSDNEIKQIDLAIKRLSREVRLECRHGHPGVIIFKVHMGDDEWMELSGKKHGHDDFVKYGLIDFEMDQEFDRVYNNMRESYSHVKLQHEAGSVFLKESVPIDERMFVFGRGTSSFELAIKAFTGAIAWRKKLYDQRCLSKARDDDSFTEEEYKKKIGELKVKFCEYLKKAIEM